MKTWVSVATMPTDGIDRLARLVEELGLEGMAFSDHTSIPMVVESRHPERRDEVPTFSADMVFPNPFVTMACLGSTTTRIRFTTHVLIAPPRHPILLAKEVATASALIGGRVDLGVGVGWIREEYDSLGVPFEQRGSRLDEMLPLMRRLWTGDAVEHHGKHFSFEALSLRPVPAQPVRIMVGGHGPAGIRRAARLGDGWIGGFSELEELKRIVEQLSTERETAGTSGKPFAVQTALRGRVTAERVQELDALGITDLIVMPWQVVQNGSLSASSVAEGLPCLIEGAGLPADVTS